MLSRRFDLTRVLAQLRRNVVQIEGTEYVGLFRAGNATVRTSQLVLVEPQPVLLSAAAHGHVVFLAAGEVMQSKGELLIPHHAQRSEEHTSLQSHLNLVCRLL